HIDSRSMPTCARQRRPPRSAARRWQIASSANSISPAPIAMANPPTIGSAGNGWGRRKASTTISRPGAPASKRSGTFASASNGARSTFAPTNCRRIPRNTATWKCILRRRAGVSRSACRASGVDLKAMMTRREVLQVGAATAALAVGGGFTRAMARQRLTQNELLKFDALGNVTLLHVADIHGQLRPVYFREPSINLGVGAARGQPPHLTGKNFLKHFGIVEKSAAAYALSSEDFSALAKSYGRIGGLDRLATVVRHVRGERGDKVLLLDSGDTWQGSLGVNQSRGQDMVDCMAPLKPDAMTGHWEFTYGEARVKELIKGLGFPFLALNVRDTEWNEPVFDAMKMFERGGVKIAVLGQAFPYTPVA